MFWVGLGLWVGWVKGEMARHRQLLFSRDIYEYMVPSRMRAHAYTLKKRKSESARDAHKQTWSWLSHWLRAESSTSAVARTLLWSDVCVWGGGRGWNGGGDGGTQHEGRTHHTLVGAYMYMYTNKCQTHALAALPPPVLADEAGGRQRVVEAERGVEAGLGLVVAHLVAHVLVAVAVCVWDMCVYKRVCACVFYACNTHTVASA